MKSRNNVDALVIIIPGLLDRATYNANRLLADKFRSTGAKTVVLDMYDLPGVAQSKSDQRVYDCDWTPADILKSVRQIIDLYPGADVTLVGFSYGGQMALLYGVPDASLGWNRVSHIVSIMPPDYFHWEGYDADRDLELMLYHYRKHGTTDLGTSHSELRSESILNPNPKDTITVNISRHSINAHLMPYDRFLDGNSLPVGIMGLAETGILRRVTARTLVIAGWYNKLVPDANDQTQQIYKSLNPNNGNDLGLLPIQHDYRISQTQIKLVNDFVTDWRQFA